MSNNFRPQQLDRASLNEALLTEMQRLLLAEAFARAVAKIDRQRLSPQEKLDLSKWESGLATIDGAIVGKARALLVGQRVRLGAAGSCATACESALKRLER